MKRNYSMSTHLMHLELIQSGQSVMSHPYKWKSPSNESQNSIMTGISACSSFTDIRNRSEMKQINKFDN